ncbi:metal ABC transporter ATP-binding protein [Clostridium senegalense]|uniref:Metal ABC transporter ATP-binding protein n=1 Tax=Clostridium senegalense TaxID=1465809 RepID=A0A6M0H214_9CLOT|nr:metal ABC transporter ATP-binding protein [Clostridium senegalense]NEU04776.1 metal ABC transporter ATP-binding protein [Clostridium senegalense]
MISIDSLSFSYNCNKNYLLKDINLNIKSGSYVSIIGENGSGKTTLIKLILNLIKPSKGSISLSSKNISYVPQRITNLNAGFPITVYEVLDVHRKVLKIKDKDCIINALKSVNMYNFKDCLIGSLSGGQQQKILIARAIISKSDLIILDEPSTALDEQSTKDLYSIITKLNKEESVTILSIEHNIKLAIKNSSHILYVKDGNALLHSTNDNLDFLS